MNRAITDTEVAPISTTRGITRAPDTLTLEPDLEAVIVAAATGKGEVDKLLRPVVYAIALEALLERDVARRVTERVFGSIGGARRRIGAPRPGCAVRWLRSVVLHFAAEELERRDADRWESWDPPHPPPEERPKPPDDD